MNWFIKIAFAWALLLSVGALAETEPGYRLSVGDDIKISVFQNPDLALETRVSGDGTITYPLIGSVEVVGKTIDQAQTDIAKGLEKGGFIKQPQVSIYLVEVRGNQYAVLGQVNRPGRYPLDISNIRISDALAVAGGATPTGSDIVILTGQRAGKPFRKEVDITHLFLDGKDSEDIDVKPGDTLYVDRAPMFYIYGEVQRPGTYPVVRGMTVTQALVTGGGPTLRGSESRLKLKRRSPDGKVEQSSPTGDELLKPNDVLYIPESIF